MPSFPTQSIEGVDLTAIYDAISTSTPEIPAWPFKVGDRVVATDGSNWMFCTAGGGINQYDVVKIVQTTLSATQMLGGAASEVPSRIVGFYQNATAMTSGQAAWFMISGKPRINVLGACVKNVQLYTTDTSGKLDDAIVTGSQFPIRGVYIASTNPSATATSIQATAMFPAIPQRTAANPRVAPEPMTQPVIVCVVETGKP